jgi:phage terminase small subunit
MSDTLTPKQEMFCQEYLVDMNAKNAAIRAGYSEDTAQEQGSRLLSNVKVAERIAALQAERSERTEITVDKVLEQYWDIATADPNELIQLRRICCRYCHGAGFEYQWTKGEYDRRCWEIDEANENRSANKQVPHPKTPGGFGYDRRKVPNPDCPECFGEGREDVHALDTRKLKGPAKHLLAGVKFGKDGLEIKMHDKMKALDAVARHLGMNKEKFEVTGKDGQPLEGSPTERLAGLVALIERARARAGGQAPDSNNGGESSAVA